MKSRRTHGFLLLILLSVLGACSSTPPAPAWKVQAQDAVGLATLATLTGQEKVAQQQWKRALSESQKTAQAAQMARIALIRCAVERTSWVTQNCPAFEDLRLQASAEDQAYARYLFGQTEAADIALLPAVHRPIATRLLADPGKASANTNETALSAAIAAVPDPLSRLVAVHAALQHGQARLSSVGLAVDSASEQGWQKALLGWLALQQRLAEQSGDTRLAQQAQARLKLLLGTGR